MAHPAVFLMIILISDIEHVKFTKTVNLDLGAGQVPYTLRDGSWDTKGQIPFGHDTDRSPPRKLRRNKRQEHATSKGEECYRSALRLNERHVGHHFMRVFGQVVLEIDMIVSLLSK
jgi:hypothetical protein